MTDQQFIFRTGVASGVYLGAYGMWFALKLIELWNRNGPSRRT